MSLNIDDVFNAAQKATDETGQAIDDKLENFDPTNQKDLLELQRLVAKNQLAYQVFSSLLNNVKEVGQTIAKSL